MEELIDLQTVQQSKSDEIALPEGATSLSLLQQVYRNPSLPLPTRTRAAIAALPFEHPKLAVVATVDAGGDFAFKLDQAIERSRKVSPMIEAKANDTVNVSSDSRRPHMQGSINGKPMIPDRRYRRW